MKNISCQTLSKCLDISSATARVAPDLLKALAILSDTTVRRSAVDRKDLKPYWKSEKRPHFSRWSNNLVTCFSKTLLTTGKKTNRAGVFSCRPYPNILKYRDDWRKPLTIWKTRLFWTQFFRTTTGIQSGPNACDKSRLVMTFLTIFGVTEMLYSFRLVLEAKTGREIPDSSRSEFLEKF